MNAMTEKIEQGESPLTVAECCLLMDAAGFANQAHAGQVRKGDGSPYIEHPARVSARIGQMKNSKPTWQAAAWLHDTIEDCGITYEQLRKEFGAEVADLVAELTNPSKQFPDLPRAEKKAMDRAHVALISRPAKIIKLADRADNLRDGIRTMPTDWLRTYVGETKALFEVLRGVDDGLEQELANAISLAEGVI